VLARYLLDGSFINIKEEQYTAPFTESSQKGGSKHTLWSICSCKEKSLPLATYTLFFKITLLYKRREEQTEIMQYIAVSNKKNIAFIPLCYVLGATYYHSLPFSL
jgi:hypothetical protein